MPLLPGKLICTCPRTGEPSDVKRTCLECRDFQHVTYRGTTPYIACNYEASPPQPKPKTSKTFNELKKW